MVEQPLIRYVLRSEVNTQAAVITQDVTGDATADATAEANQDSAINQQS